MKTTLAERGVMLDAFRTEFNSGKMRIYSGTRPADAETALAGNTLLAELTMNATAFPASATSSTDRVLTANAITSTTDAAAGGTATFARFFKSDGTTVLCDMSVGTSGAEVILNTLTIVQHQTVSCSACTVTFPTGS